MLEQRVLQSAIGALELFGLYLGDRLGLYAALRDGHPRTPGELAELCGIHPGYAREWLEQQAVAGFLEVAGKSEDPAARSYRLPEEHAAGAPVELWLVEGGRHAALFERAPEEWERRVVGFLARSLGGAGAGGAQP